MAASNTTQVRVRYAETDQMGVVYHANYFAWFEVGRCELLRSLGWSYREMEAEGVALPVIQAGCDYVSPGHYDDVLDIHTTGTLVSAVRVQFDYHVRRGETSLATGRTVHAALNTAGRPCRLPQRVRDLLS